MHVLQRHCGDPEIESGDFEAPQRNRRRSAASRASTAGSLTRVSTSRLSLSAQHRLRPGVVGHPVGPVVTALARAMRAQSTRAENMPLAEVVEPFLKWLEGVRGRSPHTIRGYAADLRGFVPFAEQIGCPRPHDVSFREIELYMAMLRERGAAPATINRAVYALGSFWTFLRREGVATNDPTRDVFKLKEPVRLPVDIPIDEQERLLTGLAELRAPIGSRDCAIIAGFLLTGVRLGKLTRLRVDQVAQAGGLVRVIGKGDKQREIPLIQRLALTLRTYLTDARPRLLDGTDGPWLFVAGNGKCGGWRAKRPGEPMAERSIYRIVVARTEEILGRRIHPHVLRHSFASRLRSRGGDLQEVQQLMGHAEIGTTMRYSHITPTRKGRLEELLT